MPDNNSTKDERKWKYLHVSSYIIRDVIYYYEKIEYKIKMHILNFNH